MCGRFTLAVETAELETAFGPFELPQADLPLQPRFNIAPSQQVAALRPRADGAGRELVALRWGLIPRWAEDEKVGHRMINARSETAAEKPSFRQAFQQRRCVVPATGFYEWRTEGRRKKPFLIRRRDRKPFGIAGLWEGWRGAAGQVESCALLTRQAQGSIAELHDRMPVILMPADLGIWLDPAADPAGRSLSLPFDVEAWEIVPANPALNDPKREGEECIADWDEAPEGTLPLWPDPRK